MIHWAVKGFCGAALSGAVGMFIGCAVGTPADGPAEGDVTETSFTVFVDPDSDFATSDVRDVDEEIVRFDGQAKAIIWVTDDLTFGEGFWEIDGNFLGDGRQFQVRFGTKEGERRAYFTETVPATICDLFVEEGMLRIVPTDSPVPQE